METCFAESHAAAVKHNVIRVEKTMGVVKAHHYRKTGGVKAAETIRGNRQGTNWGLFV